MLTAIIIRRSSYISKYRRGISSSAGQLSRPTNNNTSTNNSTTPIHKATDDTAISEDSTIATNIEKSKLATNCIQPRPIFPWISSIEPLPRLIQPDKPSVIGGNNPEDIEEDNDNILKYYESDYFAKGGPLGQGWLSPCEPWFRGALYANSMQLLGVSWPSIVLPWTRNNWIHNMEQSFMYAFSNGVNAMIHDTYILPENKTCDDKEETSEDSTTPDENSEYDVNMDITLNPIKLEEKKEIGPGANNTFTREEEENSMLQRNLRQLYQSAKQHSHPTKVNICLKTVPQSATIESMFPVFGLSRSLVEDHPNLRHTYRNMLKRLQEKHKDAILAGKSRLNPIEVGSFIMNGLQEVMERSANLSSNNSASITIVAQVSINCKEIFCVQDVETGDIIQGYGDGQPRNVTHLVRFEMVVREKMNSEDDWDQMELGRWQITDWDDILDGNVFFT